jgi:hypothetical protein
VRGQGMERSVRRYFFTIRGPDHVKDDPDARTCRMLRQYFLMPSTHSASCEKRAA